MYIAAASFSFEGCNVEGRTKVKAIQNEKVIQKITLESLNPLFAVKYVTQIFHVLMLSPLVRKKGYAIAPIKY